MLSYVINITGVGGLISILSLLSLILTGPETDDSQGSEDTHHHVEHHRLVVHHTQHYGHGAQQTTKHEVHLDDDVDDDYLLRFSHALSSLGAPKIVFSATDLTRPTQYQYREC